MNPPVNSTPLASQLNVKVKLGHVTQPFLVGPPCAKVLFIAAHRVPG